MRSFRSRSDSLDRRRGPFRGNIRQRKKLFLMDPLTGGYNREGFLKQASHYIVEQPAGSYLLVSMNICGFRHINELWGEESGNETLQFVYRVLKANVGEKELVCRSSIDRFLLLLKEREQEKVAQRVQDAICQMNEKIRIHFEGYTLGFAVGGCPVLQEGVTQAITNASYAVKESRQKNCCVFYGEEMKQKLAEEIELNEQFEESIQNHDFQIYLQPQVALRSGRECQAEALVRWIHPQKGVIAPGQFISLFEKNGKIVTLDLYVFEEVCRQVSRWIADKQAVSRISVNISRFHLRNMGVDVWKKYKEIKEKYQIPDDLIEVELTETILLDLNQIEFVKEILNRFRSCGFRVALDDFGFAYSSLVLLKEFEIDTLKMDRSFFLNETEKSRKIVKNIIGLAHSLDMQVVAEGIETEEQVAALREMDCDFIQGYVYSKPIPVTDFEVWRRTYEQ